MTTLSYEGDKGTRENVEKKGKPKRRGGDKAFYRIDAAITKMLEVTKKMRKLQLPSFSTVTKRLVYVSPFLFCTLNSVASFFFLSF